MLKRILLFMFSIFCAVHIFALEVSVPEKTKQGDFITVYLFGKENIKQAFVELIDTNGKSHYKISAIPVGEDAKKQIAILAIPSFLKPGLWTVKIMAMEGLLYREKAKHIMIAKTEFKEYTMQLNAKNTTLLTKADPKKKAESQALTELLCSINREANIYPNKFIVPTTSKRITSTFAEKRTLIYTNGKKASETHWGVDFAIPVGSKILAPADGTIVFSGNRIVTGGTVIIEHAPGVYTLFYHLSKTPKALGDRVKAGELIALSGNTGYSTGPHLHWELRINSVPVSPFSLLEKPLYDSQMLQ